MTYIKELNLKQRIVNLTKLLIDSKLLGFNLLLVNRYEKQLVNLLVVQAENKRVDKESRESILIGQHKEVFAKVRY